jgi:hypothetical protein
VKKHRLAFWDAMLWAAAQRAGVRGVRFVNPFEPANDRLVDEILPLE